MNKYCYCAEVFSNYKIMSAKICLSLHRNKKQNIKASWYDWSSFENTDISNQYDEYENFVTAHREADAECIPTKSRVKCTVP